MKQSFQTGCLIWRHTKNKTMGEHRYGGLLDCAGKCAGCRQAAGLCSLAAAAVEAYGGHYLARGGASETTEGSDYARNVIVCWPDMATAQTAYHSPEYAHAREVLGDGADRLFVIVDGLPA